MGAVEGSPTGAGLALAAVCDEVVGARAREVLMTGREIGAEEASHMGLATELVEPGGALAATSVRAGRYEAMPSLAVAHVRLALAHIGSLDDAIEAEADLQRFYYPTLMFRP